MTIVVDVDLAGGVQLRDHLLGVLILSNHAIKLSKLRLRLLKPRQPILDVLLLEHGLLFVGLHLGLCSSPLGADFQHVHRRTFVDCQKTKWIREYIANEVLTGNGGAGSEGGRHIWVQFNKQIALLSHMLVARLDLLLDPVAEFVFKNGVSNVGDPLLRQLTYLLLDWIVGESLRILADELIQPLDLQRLVLWDLKMFTLVRSDNWRYKTIRINYE